MVTDKGSGLWEDTWHITDTTISIQSCPHIHMTLRNAPQVSKHTQAIQLDYVSEPQSTPYPRQRTAQKWVYLSLAHVCPATPQDIKDMLQVDTGLFSHSQEGLSTLLTQ